MPNQIRVTDAVLDFIAGTGAGTAAGTSPELSPVPFPADARAIAKRCIIDGLGVMLAGSTQPAATLLRDYVKESDSRQESTAFGTPPFTTGAAAAALVNGTSGHALDWDDTQLATSADRIFGLLTHPTVPPLVAALAVGERQHATGAQVLDAFLTG